MDGKRFKTLLIGVGTVALIGCIAGVTIASLKDSTPGTAHDNELLSQYEQMTAEKYPKAYEILKEMPIIDGHNDFPWQTRQLIRNDLRLVNFSDDLTKVEPWASHDESYTDIPRLRKGMVGAQFWVAYTPCVSHFKDSVSQTLEQIDIIKRLANDYDDLHFASSVADIEYALENHKIASLIGIEGGHSIQSSMGILRQMYELGARYMTLSHSCNLAWVDASPVDSGSLQPVNDGLSDFGLEVIDEMNRLGMLVDLSHVSTATMKKAIARSKAPVIFSHSSAKAICNHHRNVEDDVLRMVKENNGIVMVNFYSRFVQCDKQKNATLADVVEHIEHIRSIAGVDHLGIGADYDGVDEVPEGLEDVSKYPALIETLANSSRWSDEELKKMAGANLIRVFRDVERVRDELAQQRLEEDLITRKDIDRAEISTSCVTADFVDDPKSQKAKRSTKFYKLPSCEQP